MFWSETVVDGDDDGRDLAGELAANGVVGEVIGAEECEAAAVKEDGDGEGRGAGMGNEDADPEVTGGVDGEIGGGDAVKWGGWVG